MASLSRVTRINNPALLYALPPSPFPIPTPLTKNQNPVSATSKRNSDTRSTNFPNISTTTKLLRASTPLNIPIYITTQSRDKLGATVPELTTHLTSNPLVRADLDKTLFSMITPEMETLLPSPEKGEKALDVIIVGIETHICVLQTTMDLLRRGHRVYVCLDGVSSVNKEERGVAVARMRDAGAIVTTSESLLFEMLGDAGHEGFRGVSGLVREMKEETRGAVEGLAKI
ncbi:isochorismatase family hydrolase [Aspergillus luchuensis]|uniref:Isochorismatase family hydrolase n=1 Tax=Aspergillus kawachii TaxID=1069201 RepID=A0A146FXJ2_ASPKA|nr:isochorismatase family hydrolase [Aspergillus luchuensis IFO 4308]GAT30236.1 isochorismatase family hydrolase [Aspergillus luchuensis]